MACLVGSEMGWGLADGAPHRSALRFSFHAAGEVEDRYLDRRKDSASRVLRALRRLLQSLEMVSHLFS
jgi:hypothetical protein